MKLIAEALGSKFSSPKLHPLWRASCPGRINLIGEHTDYNGGKVLPFAMDRAIAFRLERDPTLVDWQDAIFSISTSSHAGRLEVTARDLAKISQDTEHLPPSTDLRNKLPSPIITSWTRYALGALIAYWRLSAPERAHKGPALSYIHIDSQLPYGAGISSSAALSAGLIALLLQADQIPLVRQDIARAAMRVEHQFAGIRCGLMDQLAVLMCERDALLLIDFLELATEDRIKTQAIRLHPSFAPYRAMLINTMVKHELGSSPYNERRLACERGVAVLGQKLGKTYPTAGHLAADLSFMQRFAASGRQEQLIAQLSEFAFAHDRVTAKRLAHAIMEVKRVDDAVEAIKQGDFSRLSAAMNASHLSLAQDYEVSCPELDTLRLETLEMAQNLGKKRALAHPAILGARMTGGGFGGSTIQLVHQDIIDELSESLHQRDTAYYRAFGLLPEVIVTSMASGLHLEPLT